MSTVNPENVAELEVLQGLVTALSHIGQLDDFISAVAEESQETGAKLRYIAEVGQGTPSEQNAALAPQLETRGEGLPGGELERQLLASEARQDKVASRPRNTTSTYQSGLRHYKVGTDVHETHILAASLPY